MSKINGRSAEQDLFMIQSQAQGDVEKSSMDSKTARDGMENIQGAIGSILGALGGILKTVFSKGGGKGGGKGG